MKRVMGALAGLLLAGCAGTAPPLEVKQFALRDTSLPSNKDPMMRGEVQRRLHGAVSEGERRDRIGQYYTVMWRDEAAGEPVDVVFAYQQAATGSAVKRMVQRFAAGQTEGRAEFEVTGEDFRRNGRVLAWRVSLLRGGQEVASEQSYLWQ